MVVWTENGDNYLLPCYRSAVVGRTTATGPTSQNRSKKQDLRPQGKVGEGAEKKERQRDEFIRLTSFFWLKGWCWRECAGLFGVRILDGGGDAWRDSESRIGFQLLLVACDFTCQLSTPLPPTTMKM